MFIFAFSLSYLMPLFFGFHSLSTLSPSISPHSPALLSALSDQASCSCGQQAGERSKKKAKRKVRESFRQRSRPPYNAYSTSQNTRGIQLHQTSRSAIIHPDITPSSFFPPWLSQIHHQTAAFRAFNPSPSPSAIHLSVSCSLLQGKMPFPASVYEGGRKGHSSCNTSRDYCIKAPASPP